MPFLLLHMCYFWAMLACFKLPYLPSASFACLTPKDWDCSARCWLSQKESRVLPLQNSAVILFKVCTIMQKLQFWLQRCCPTAVTGWVLAGMIFFFLNSGGFLFWFDFPETGKVRLFLFHWFLQLAVIAGVRSPPLASATVPAGGLLTSTSTWCLRWFFLKLTVLLSPSLISFIVRHANTVVSALLTDKWPFSDFTKQYNPFVPITCCWRVWPRGLWEVQLQFWTFKVYSWNEILVMCVYDKIPDPHF